MSVLLHQKGVLIDPLKRADWTPLMLACTKPCEPVVRILVEHGASLTLRNKDGWTAFHLACRTGNVSIVAYLLDRDPTVLLSWSKNGRMPLHTAGSLINYIACLIQTIPINQSLCENL